MPGNPEFFGYKNPLCIPFWAMTFDELSFFLVGRQPGKENSEDKRLREEILKLKKENADKLKAGRVNEEYITVDSPIPFDIRQMWHNFNREVYSTHSEASQDKQTRDTEMLIDEGDPKTLKPATFQPYTMNNQAPYKSKNQVMYNYESKIHSRLKDPRFDFVLNPGDFYDASSKFDMDELLKGWIDNEHRISILDLSGIPFELVDLSVGLITRMIFDSMYWGRFEKHTGRDRPLLMVYEEAHSYLPKGEANSFVFGYARKAVEKVFKEGRKFGMGSLVVTQRPSEISETILAQVGTYIALRLTNSSDKNSVQAACPNNMSSLMDLLPSLRIGEAVVVGEAIIIPTRVKIKLVEPRPSSNDPELVECWFRENGEDKADYKKVVTALREQKHIKEG